jgi:uncharacterized paraquat-inducible protein A
MQDIITNSHLFMKRSRENKETRHCRRCRKNEATDIICTSCKNELIARYDSKLDWRTALEIEKFERSANRYRLKMDDDF